MSLSPGSRLGSYEVTALIGQGGMGEVCRSLVPDNNTVSIWTKGGQGLSDHVTTG